LVIPANPVIAISEVASPLTPITVKLKTIYIRTGIDNPKTIAFLNNLMLLFNILLMVGIAVAPPKENKTAP